MANTADLTDAGVVVDRHTVRFERLLPGPIERVWAYITESDKRRRWLGAGETELRPGGRADFFFKHQELNDEPEPTPADYKHMEDGISFSGEVLEAEPPNRLRFTWPSDDGSFSEVTFELAPKGEKVLLTLTHSKLSTPTKMRNVSGGWHSHLAMLEDELAGKKRRPFWTMHTRAVAFYAERTP